MKQTNFDRYLDEQLKDKDFAARFQRAGEAWDVALQLAALRQEEGISQKELARKLNTSQQQISRLESPGYEGHSLRLLRNVAAVLHAQVRVTFVRNKSGKTKTQRARAAAKKAQTRRASGKQGKPRRLTACG